MKRVPLLMLSSLSALIACTSPGPRPDPTVKEAARGSLVMEVVASSPATGPRPLIPGSTLRSSDSFAITVVASQTLFLYVGQSSSNSPPTLLLPSGSSLPPRAMPDLPLRLPNDEKQGFQLDGKAADQTLYVLASAQALDPARAAQLLSERADRPEPARSLSGEAEPVSSTGRKSDDTVLLRQPPPTLGDTKRGLDDRKPAERCAGGRVRSQLGDDGLALLCFPLRHEP